MKASATHIDRAALRIRDQLITTRVAMANQPRRSQSGERDVNGHISKAGDSMLRRSLYEAVNSILCRVQKPFALQQWGQRIAGSEGNKRARIAVARKLAVLLHSLWLNETEFRWV